MNFINSINENIANEFSSKEDVGTYVGKLVTSISNNDEVQNALKDLFTMDSSDMPIGEVRKATDSYINTIATVIDAHLEFYHCSIYSYILHKVDYMSV